MQISDRKVQKKIELYREQFLFISFIFSLEIFVDPRNKRDGVTRQEQAQQLIEQFEAITQTLDSVRARAELIEEIETKFDEIIENTRQLQRMTRPKSVLRKLLHQ